MDAGLAKVLNSTVGTSSMKALDKVLDGVIEDVLTRNRSLVASSEPYYQFPSVLNTWYAEVTTAEKSLITLTMPLTGSATLRYKFGSSDGSGATYLRVYINGTLHKEITRVEAFNGSEALSGLVIAFSKGDVVDIRVKRSNAGRIFTYLMTLDATLVQGSAPTNVSVKV